MYAASEVKKTWIVWKHMSQADNMSSAECALITEVPLTWGICHKPQHRRLPLYLAVSLCHTPGNHPYLYPKVKINSIWYVMNCVPTNSYIEAVTPSILECDCTCRQGLERDGGGAQVLTSNCDPMHCNPPGSFVHGITSRQEYPSGLPFPASRNLPQPGIEPTSLSPALAGRFFTTSATWEALWNRSLN